MAKDKIKKRKYEFRRLEELNVIDNFLFHQMLSDKEDGEEFARILLQTFLGRHIRNVKIVPQKTILGIDTDRHGIRLDAYIEEVPDELDTNLADARIVSTVYDIEPNNTPEQRILPKRTRYYHGLVDTQFLDSGEGYDKLPNVVIIMILPYDPFGKNRMVYTVKNHCVEDPSIPYEDGAAKIFLYTNGSADNASQSLKDMLKYIQNSTNDNVTNQDIATIQQLAMKVKRKKEVGINYMKSWEYEKWVHDNAFKSGFEDGFEDGFDSGKKEGFEDGFDSGKKEGFDSGADKMSELIIRLREANREADIDKVIYDKEFREKLFLEFQLK